MNKDLEEECSCENYHQGRKLFKCGSEICLAIKEAAWTSMKKAKQVIIAVEDEDPWKK